MPLVMAKDLLKQLEVLQKKTISMNSPESPLTQLKNLLEDGISFEANKRHLPTPRKVEKNG